MQVLCVSDIIVPQLDRILDPDRFGQVDLVISCGDLPPEYLTFLRGAFDAPLYYVRGNHDIRYEDAHIVGCTNLHGKIIRHGRLKLLGLEGSRWYNGGPAQYTEAQMVRMIWRLRPQIWLKNGVDLIISHAPPRHIHDAENQCHRGFKAYRKLIKWCRPRYFLHGHIHASFSDDAQRSTLLGSTQIINCFGHYRLDIDDQTIAA
jgi:Icc-related predicted phosphoesterase